MSKDNYTVILFYKFAKMKNLDAFKVKQKAIAASFNLKGRLLIAPEGINGTFEGTTKNIKAYIKEARKQALFRDVVFKESKGNGMAFTKLMVKTRPETVTLGVGDLNAKKYMAPSISAKKLQEMYDKNEDFVVLDLRNDYEIEAGYFEKTINPKLKFFRELPEKMKELEHLKDKTIVSVCTGDIRCEKGTRLFKKEGFKKIYHLEDGIHTYMKKYPGKRFKGTLFVFDNRITTPVVEGVEREIVGKCAYCKAPCEQFYNDDSIRPSRKVICCDNCIKTRKNRLRRCIPQD